MQHLQPRGNSKAAAGRGPVCVSIHASGSMQVAPPAPSYAPVLLPHGDRLLTSQRRDGKSSCKGPLTEDKFGSLGRTNMTCDPQQVGSGRDAWAKRHLLILGAFCGDLPLQYLAGTCSGCLEHGMIAAPNVPQGFADMGQGAQTSTSSIAGHAFRLRVLQEHGVKFDFRWAQHGTCLKGDARAGLKPNQCVNSPVHPASLPELKRTRQPKPLWADGS